MTNRENILLVSLELRSLHENEFCFNSHSNAHVNCCPLLQYVIKQSFSSALSLVTKNSPNCLNFVLIYNAQCGVLINMNGISMKILKALPRMFLSSDNIYFTLKLLAFSVKMISMKATSTEIF